MAPSYVIITPARNEEAFIEETIRSVVSQTMLPKHWVIVSDGSTDRTDKIVEKYESEHDFIQLVKADHTESRNFGSKVSAFNAGYDALGTMQYDFIGNIDADISFEPSYFESLINEFGNNIELGLAGGVICERNGDIFTKRKTTKNHSSVAGAVQLFRRQCYEDIGGYTPMKAGGIDTVAEITARMKGWSVRTFPDLPVRHHRLIGTGGKSYIKSSFQKGINNYLFGYHPLFQIIISIYRTYWRPTLVTSFGLFMFFGYFWAMVRNFDRPVSDEFITFLRNEQLHKLRLKKS